MKLGVVLIILGAWFIIGMPVLVASNTYEFYYYSDPSLNFQDILATTIKSMMTAGIPASILLVWGIKRVVTSYRKAKA